MSTQTPDLKKLRNKILKLAHPDLAFDEKDRIKSDRLVQETNAAYAAGDEAALQDILRAILNPASVPPPPPQAPPNAWGPRTYPGAQQTTQAPPRPQQQAQQQTPPPAQPYHPWGTPPAQPKQYQKLSNEWHRWFWGTWLICSAIGTLIGQIGKTGTQLGDAAGLTGFWYFFLGIPLSAVLAGYRNRIKQYLAAVRAASASPKRFYIACAVVIVMVIFCSLIPVVSVSDKPAKVPTMAINKEVGGVLIPTNVRILKDDDSIYVSDSLADTPAGYVNLTKDQTYNPPPSILEPSRERKAIEQAVNRDQTVPKNAVMCIGPDTLVYTFALDVNGKAVCRDPKAVLIMKSGNLEEAKWAASDPVTPAPAPTTQSDDGFSGKYGWYVDAVKNKVAHQWYLKDVAESVPGGSTVYVKFKINKGGHSSNVSLQTSSSWTSLDQSCLNAVKRIDTFGPLPAGYGEDSLNVIYHCTYPGRSNITGELSGHGATVASEPTVKTGSAPTAPTPAEPMIIVKQSPAVPTPPAPAFDNYYALSQYVSEAIEAQWSKSPVIPVPVGVRVIVRFVIDRNGRLSQAYVTDRSGYLSVDEQCLQAVNHAVFNPPTGYQGDLWDSYTCKVGPGQTSSSEHSVPAHFFPVAAPVDSVWRTYEGVVDGLIQTRWNRTAYAGGVGRWTNVRFTVSPDGLVGNPTVAVSSGSPAIDAACKNAVGEGWYAPRLPEGLDTPVYIAFTCE